MFTQARSDGRVIIPALPYIAADPEHSAYRTLQFRYELRSGVAKALNFAYH